MCKSPITHNQTINLTKHFSDFVRPIKAPWFWDRSAWNLHQMIGNHCQNALKQWWPIKASNTKGLISGVLHSSKKNSCIHHWTVTKGAWRWPHWCVITLTSAPLSWAKIRSDFHTDVTSSHAWRDLARIVARDGSFTLSRSAPLSRECQILNFENRTIIKGDTAIFVKAYQIPNPGAFFSQIILLSNSVSLTDIVVRFRDRIKAGAPRSGT